MTLSLEGDRGLLSPADERREERSRIAVIRQARALNVSYFLC